MTTATEIKIHKFEAAGLGRAPFRFTGIETAADRAAVQRERENGGLMFTTNHSTSCDYCGQGIQNAYGVQSADGKRFKVGCDCIRKTGDAGLVRFVTEEEGRKRRVASTAKRAAKVKHEAELIAAFRAGRCDSLKGHLHPKGREGTAFDYVEWCVNNKCYGQTILKMIEDAAAAF